MSEIQESLPGLRDADPLTNLLHLLSHAETIEAEMTALEQKAAGLKDVITQIREKTAPDLMRQIGIEELRFSNGTRIILDTKYFANVSEKREEEAFKWLRENNHGGIIKTNIFLPEVSVDAIKASGLPYVAKDTVAPATLKAWVAEMKEEGHPFPEQLFGVFEKTQVIKKGSKK